MIYVVYRCIAFTGEITAINTGNNINYYNKKVAL